MKKAIIGIGLIISGTIGVSAQRIIDTIYIAGNCRVAHGGFHLLLTISVLAIAAGIIFCALSLRNSDK